jgi:hypothetical protein
VTLRADLSHLPTATAPATDGNPPDAEPRFVQVLAESWAETSDSDKPTALGTRVRHSDAGKCARAIAYTAAGIPKSDPMDLTGVWNTSLGTLLHEKWQDALVARWPDAEIEPKVGHPDLDASGHLDAIIRTADKVIVYELKTIGGFGFKAAVGKMRKGTPAEGPKREHVLQAALNGIAVDADEVVIGYLAKECISINAGLDLTELGRFAAEWTYSREEYEPAAIVEKARLNGILDLVDKGELAARKFPPGALPPGAEITDPARGMWTVTDDEGTITNTGTYWACAYCSHRTVCASTEPGRISIESVTVTP